MFFVIALFAAAGFALQNVLMTPYYRKLDTQSAVTYRSISLIVSMLPLLALGDLATFSVIIKNLNLILYSSIAAAFACYFGANAVKFFPVGIASALCNSFSIIFFVIFVTIFSDASVSLLQVILIFLLLTVLFPLSTNKKELNSLNTGSSLKGTVSTFLFGFNIAISFYILSLLSSRADPLIAAYFWETGISVILISSILFRRVFTGYAIERVSLRDFWSIFLRSSPTLVGTGCLGMAYSLGNPIIAQAINSTQIVFCVIFGSLFLAEHLNRKQVILTILCLILVVCLKLS